MALPRKDADKAQSRRRPPATTPESRENQMISLAVGLAEKQLLEGTASAQVLTHYLKLGTEREKLEREKLAKENQLLKIKADSIASSDGVEQLYREALDAMRSYSGQDPEEDHEA